MKTNKILCRSISSVILCITLFSLPSIGFTQIKNDVADESQLSEITVNLDKGTISSEFPFDRRFKLKVISTKLELAPEFDVFPMNFRKGKKKVRENVEIDTVFYPTEIHKDSLEAIKKYIQASFTSFCDNYFEKKKKRKCKRIGKKKAKKIKILKSVNKPYIEYSKKKFITYNKTDFELELKQIYLRTLKGVKDNEALDVYKDHYKYDPTLDSLRLEHGNAEIKVTKNAMTTIEVVNPPSLVLTKKKKGEYFAIMPELKPHKLYDVVFRRLPTEKETNSFYKVVELCGTDRNKAKLTYMKEIEKTERSQRNTEKKKFSESFGSFSFFTYPIIDRNIKILEENISSLLAKRKLQDPTFFQAWDKEKITIVGKKIKDYKLNIKNYSIVTYPFLQDTENFNQITIEHFFTGRNNFEKIKVLDKHDYKKRVNALTTNSKNLDTLITEIQKIKVSDTSAEIDYVSKKVADTKSFLDSILTEFKKFDKFVQSIANERIAIALPVSSSTSSPEIKTKNSQVIITDFGFLVARAYNSQGETTIIPRPTVGFNLHFGGIDKNQELQHILNEKIRHRWSLSLGITVGKIENGSYTDLFNGISPYLGINCRLDEQIRIGGGVLFINDTDPNPILDKKIFDPAPYLMVSFDFENLFSKLGKVATKIVN